MTTTTQPSRVRALDIARGLVMVLMAIDHVRVYAGVPAGGPAPADLLHALGDAFLRTGLRVLRRRVGVPARVARSPGTAELSRYLLRAAC